MYLRVTNGMTTNDLLYNLDRLRTQINTNEAELSSGNAIAVPADNPGGAVQIVGLQVATDQNTAYQGSANQANGWLNYTQSSYQNLTGVLQKIYQLGIQAENGTNKIQTSTTTINGVAVTNPSDLTTIGSEVSSLLQQAVAIANSQYGTRYIFAGTMTAPTISVGLGGTPWVPYSLGSATTVVSGTTLSLSSVSFSGNTVSMSMELNSTTSLAVNQSAVTFPLSLIGASAATLAQNGTVYYALNQVSALANDLQVIAAGGTTFSATSLMQQDVAGIQSALNVVNNAVTTVGTQIQEVQQATQDLTNQSMTIQTAKAQIQGVDPAKVMLDLSTEQAALKAALQAGAQLIQPSLISFLQ